MNVFSASFDVHYEVNMPDLPASPSSRAITLVVHDGIEDIAADWLNFEQSAAGSFYQSLAWCRAWIETIGGHHDAEPRIVVGRYASGEIAFLLPLCIGKRFGLRILEWIADRQNGYGYGLYHRSFLPDAAEWLGQEGWRIIELVKPVDAVSLQRMPAVLHGFPHPLSQWFSLKGRNKSYVMRLAGNFEALYARKRSAETRRGNRKRDAKLASCGALQFGLPQSCEETHRLLDVMFDQQKARLAEAGIAGVFGDGERSFIHRVAESPGALLPYHLRVGGEVAAVMLGGHFDNTYWALISSLGDGAYRRHSPGDAALRQMIEACCSAGLTTLDFGSGDTSYKEHWADDTIQLYDAVRGITLSGYVWAFSESCGILSKRVIKRTPALWALATWWRRTFGVRR